MKKLIIKWAIRQIKKLDSEDYATLEKYGIADILEHKDTKEKMYIFD